MSRPGSCTAISQDELVIGALIPVRYRSIMSVARRILQPWVIATLIGWSVLVLLTQVINGATVGGELCSGDAVCAETGLLPPIMWLGGVAIILALGFVARRRTG